jgi:DNA-binding protein Fis
VNIFLELLNIHATLIADFPKSGSASFTEWTATIPAMSDEKQEPHVEDDQLPRSSPPIQEPHKSIGRIAPQDVADCLPPNLQEKSSRVEVPAAEKSVELAVARRVHEMLAQKCGHIYYQVQAAADRAVLREVLQHAKGNQVEAADVLGISRTTLRSKLRSLGLVVEKQVADAQD